MILTSQRRIRSRICGAMELQYEQSILLIVLCGSLLLIPIVITAETEEMLFKSGGPTGIREGTFSSPGWPNKYPSGKRIQYKFVARHNERVLLKFNHFNVEGLSKECVKDFVDIYIQLHSIEDMLSDTILLGRYCGHTLEKVPKTLTSMYNIIVLDFYADKTTQENYNHDDHMGNLGFNGTYSFIPDGPYNIGDPLIDGGCSFAIDRRKYSMGRILSPTYPGVYPNNLNCTFLFKGEEDERIRLSFSDFDLYERSKSCPVDYVEIFDDITRNRSKRIGQLFCGEQRNLVVYSTRNKLRLEFITGKGRTKMGQVDPYPDNRLDEKIQIKGFSADFRFSRDFIDIHSDVLKHNHYRGTECDFFIKSNKTSQGVLYSPNFPSGLVPGKVCTYFVYGIYNKQDRERVDLRFTRFDLPESDRDGVCRRGHLSIFLSVQNYVNGIPKSILCGRIPSVDVVRNNRNSIDTQRESQLIMVLNTTNLPKNSGTQYLFEAHYKFLVDFGIDGRIAKSGSCHYIYKSEYKQWGDIKSPFYPDHYPVNQTCRYDLETGGKYFVRLTFQNFHTADKPMERPGKKDYHKAGMACTRDYLQISELVPNKKTGAMVEHHIVRYCAIFIPGPWVTDIHSHTLTLRFYSNENRTTTGFIAKYEFLPMPERFQGPCGGNLTSDKHGGVIVSPNYPTRYPPGLICEWHIYPSVPGHTLMLHFADFEIEGSPRSCSYAILRIYEEDDVLPHSELCGTDTNIPSFKSRAKYLRVRFLTSNTSNGAKGFKISWTELLPRIKGRCGGFECLITRYCIDPSLECNGVPNCGTYRRPDNKTRARDNSDEDLNSGHCRNASLSTGPVTASYNLLHVGIGILLTVIILVVIVVSILYREHRRTQLKQKDPLGEGAASKRLVTPGTPSSPPCNDLCTSQPPEVFSLTYRNGCGGGTLTREKMQKISIV